MRNKRIGWFLIFIFWVMVIPLFLVMLTSCSIKAPKINISGSNHSVWSNKSKIYEEIHWQYYYSNDVSYQVTVQSNYASYVNDTEIRNSNSILISFILTEPSIGGHYNGFNFSIDVIVDKDVKTSKTVTIDDFDDANPIVNIDIDSDVNSIILPSSYCDPIDNYQTNTFAAVIENYSSSSITTDIKSHMQNVLCADLTNTFLLTKNKLLKSYGDIKSGNISIRLKYNVSTTEITELNFKASCDITWLIFSGNVSIEYLINQGSYKLLGVHSEIDNNDRHYYPDKSSVMGNIIDLIPVTANSSYSYKFDLKMPLYTQKYQQTYQFSMSDFYGLQAYQRTTSIHLVSWYLSKLTNITLAHLDIENHPKLTLTNNLFPSDDQQFSDRFLNNDDGAFSSADTHKYKFDDLTIEQIESCMNNDWKTFTFDMGGDSYSLQWYQLIGTSMFKLGENKQPQWTCVLSECLDNGWWVGWPNDKIEFSS